VWVAAERRELFTALGDAATAPAALIEIVRGRLEGLGPVTAQAIAASLRWDVAGIELALVALQTEGFAMRGQFTPGSAAIPEWCERRLLARIHRYTVNRLARRNRAGAGARLSALSL
jgi:ATP-dependent Lhr-like helicase